MTTKRLTVWLAAVVFLTGCGNESEPQTSPEPEGPKVWGQRELIKKLKFDDDAFREEFLKKQVRAKVMVGIVQDLGKLWPDQKGETMVACPALDGVSGDVSVSFKKDESLFDRLRAMKGEWIEIEGVVELAGLADGNAKIIIGEAILIRIY